MNALMPSARFDDAQPTTRQHPATGSSVAVIDAAIALLPVMETGRRIDANHLRSTLSEAFKGSDADGAWDWKTAYDVCEIASVLFLRKYGVALKRLTPPPSALLPTLHKVAGLLPTHTRRSIDSQTYQQFSTPMPLGWVAATAAMITADDTVLEPSAGTGLLAVLAEMLGARLILNELEGRRADALNLLFPKAQQTRFDAAQIDDYLDAASRPSVVLMNPPFSVLKGVAGTVKGAAVRHMRSAFNRVAPGGRLVAITGAGLSPELPAWRDAFVDIQAHGTVVFTAAIHGSVYARHGTTVETRLTVIDKTPAADPSVLVASRGTAADVETLMAWVCEEVPPRPPVGATPSASNVGMQAAITTPAGALETKMAAPAAQAPAGAEIGYQTTDWVPDPAQRLCEAVYEPYALQSLIIPGAKPHPTQLVQSAAMASVAPPKPSYRPVLPVGTVDKGWLSDAQLESVIYAGEAHSAHLAGWWRVDDTLEIVSAAAEGTDGAFQFRRGWFLGDGTGAGKGRQSAAIILDNWLKGRRKAVWISKSDKLLEDAQRDWSALGQERLLVTPLSRYKPGSSIPLDEAVLFTTYATLRSEERGSKRSRIDQIVEWLGRGFDGVIVFDEAHAMQNAAAASSEWGDAKASQQGRAGLRLQYALPDARIVYVSATGATNVHNLAYAQRLGLWGGEDFPFADRNAFIEAIENGGVAAMEVLARDLRAMGLYTARSLSYDGVGYDMLVHELTPEQIRIYDSYAEAFAVIHNNLDAAMQASNVTSDTATMNRQARSAARSAFESTKQRFFSHLLTSMKTPSLLRAIQQNLDEGHSAVVQIVSTGEALTERRLAEIPASEWSDIRVDITPREYVLDYLHHSFPVQLYEPYSVDDKILSRPVYHDGQPVQCREAVACRDGLIEKLASLPAVPGALDQLVQHFGTDMVAEVTGRSRRIIRTGDRYLVENRAGAANLVDAQAFMDDAKRILIFSEAGGTGRSYHAELSAKNRRLRVHYLLEFGWKADAAVQGLGRTNRTNQLQPPLFRPIATNVKAERRFLATIARRLDSLGALTRGQRQTGGQGLFRAEDNLESWYGRDALRQLYKDVFEGKVKNCSLEKFQSITGLKLVDATGLRDDLPPINTFLNRLLALTIEMQDVLFTAFETLMTARIEDAIAAGTYEVGLETLTALSFEVTDRRVIHQHAGSAAQSTLVSIRRRQASPVMSLQEAFERLDKRDASKLLMHAKTGVVRLQERARGDLLEDGGVEDRVALLGPDSERFTSLKSVADNGWHDVQRSAFAAAWDAELATIPEFTDDTIHVVTGLLLPIWNQLPRESARVYRLQTDQGERIVGRRVSPAWVATASSVGGISLEPADAHSALLEGKTVLSLSSGLQLRRVRAMGSNRIELSGFDGSMRDRLKAYGLFHEIISWKLRMFVPVSADGVAVLAKVLQTYPIERVSEREVA